MTEYVLWLDQLGMSDLPRVGGKNASLGEMISNLSELGVNVPGGFATTSDAFQEFLAQTGLNDKIAAALDALDPENLQQLATTGANIRQWILQTPFPAKLQQAITDAYLKLSDGQAEGASVAVRSSATAEDLPDASFAGQQETFLNVRGVTDVLKRVHEVFASLFNDRAISYRTHQGFEHMQVSLSAGVQLMVRSDLAASGVLFTLDTESGFREVVFITSAWGLGETVVQGAVNPDEFYVFKQTLRDGKNAVIRKTCGSKLEKMIYGSEAGSEVEVIPTDDAERGCFSISDSEAEQLARYALIIEAHYAKPMDIEWAKDGIDGKLYIVQARPETVQSRSQENVIESYVLDVEGEALVEGRAVGGKIAKGRVRIVPNISQMHLVKAGDILVTDMTDPDWEPVMKTAAAIVTNRGGRTCHAAIIARELGIPAVVGCGDATTRLKDVVDATVSCAGGDTGYIYAGHLPFHVNRASIGNMPPSPCKIMMNIGNPDRAFDFASIPNAGVGLARLEFIINKMIGVHPRALIDYEDQPPQIQAAIRKRIAGYDSPTSFYVDRLAEGIATIAAAVYPEPVIVRFSDFKSNEYANLLGGDRYEPVEENPMLGFRGASRYVSDEFSDCFALECQAMLKIRGEMGLANVWGMVPFVRTVDEAKATIDVMAKNGLKRGENGFKLIMMCELPSNALLADQFLDHFDGFSIGSNDLTQLTLGLDRDSGIIADLFDERNDAVKALLSMAISACKKRGKYVGICGQGPSDHPDLAKWLVDQGIESMSLNPDTVLGTWTFLAGKEE